jgi:hypothetical protein
MRVYKPRRIDEYLKGLADFLNTARANATEKEWRLFLKGIKKNRLMRSYFFSGVVDFSRPKITEDFKQAEPLITLQEAKDIRTEMHDNALQYLRTKQDRPYDALVGCLNKLELKIQYQCVAVTGRVRPGQAILRGNDKNWASRSWTLATNIKELLYTILATALVNGTLNRLQVCKECGRYIAVKQRNRRFCPGTSCKDDFFNREKTQDPDFKKTARIKRRVVV